MALRKPGQIGCVCPGKGIDRLSDITDHAHVMALPQPQVQEALLQRGHVLVLIDHKIAVLRADMPGNILTCFHQAAHQNQHVLKVDDGAIHFRFLVSVKQASEL